MMMMMMAATQIWMHRYSRPPAGAGCVYVARPVHCERIAIPERISVFVCVYIYIFNNTKFQCVV